MKDESVVAQELTVTVVARELTVIVVAQELQRIKLVFFSYY